MELSWAWLCAPDGVVWGFLHLPFAFLTEVCPSPPPHLVLADKGSTSSLSSPEVSHQPQESSPRFVILLLHLEAVSSHRAAMFFLGKGVEGSGWASQLSSASKPSLFPPPLSRPTSKKALSGLLGQFQGPAGQKYPGDPPSLAGWSSHPFPTPTLSWRDFPLPAWSLLPSCKEARHGRGVFLAMERMFFQDWWCGVGWSLPPTTVGWSHLSLQQGWW